MLISDVLNYTNEQLGRMVNTNCAKLSTDGCAGFLHEVDCGRRARLLSCNQQIGVACPPFTYVDVELHCSFKNSMLPIQTGNGGLGNLDKQEASH